MKSKKSKNSKPQTALELGQDFLNSFKELPYSEDRLGESVVMKASSAGLRAGNADLYADPFASESPSETDKRQKYRVTLKPKRSEPKPSEPATEEPETAQEDLSLFFEYIRFLRAIDRD